MTSYARAQATPPGVRCWWHVMARVAVHATKRSTGHWPGCRSVGCRACHCSGRREELFP